ncbi:V-type ATPase subunit [Hutsoniella sourekii]|uniref:V-type ATPase subunit n=1 Tax=Hutsoniella sourekii TaxID=87650 RepID=UPI0004BC7BDF|nr:V-type ATPase subunit [Hutsoniella sourekii]
MSHDFSQINTTISIHETSFLTIDDFKDLLDSPSEQQSLRILEDTNYFFRPEDLRTPQAIEGRLMNQLADEYKWIYEETPCQEVVDIFGSSYLFHNLKLFSKMLVTDKDLDELLIPIGPYPLNELHHLAQTQESDIVDKTITDNIREIWREFQGYQDTEVFDVGLDMAYFDYLRVIAERLDLAIISQLVEAIIGFYNITTGLRAVQQDKPNSFMYEMMSDKADLSIEEFIDLVRENQVLSWFKGANQLPFNHGLQTFEQRLSQGKIDLSEIENGQDFYIHQLLTENRFQTDGPIPILRYLFGKEMEVKNLRLILVGRLNDLKEEQIIERMRPVYGQTV